MVVYNGVEYDSNGLAPSQALKISNNGIKPCFTNAYFQGLFALKLFKCSGNDFLHLFPVGQRDFKRHCVRFDNFRQFIATVNHNQRGGFFVEAVDNVPKYTDCFCVSEMLGEVERYANRAWFGIGQISKAIMGFFGVSYGGFRKQSQAVTNTFSDRPYPNISFEFGGDIADYFKGIAFFCEY